MYQIYRKAREERQENPIKLCELCALTALAHGASVAVQKESRKIWGPLVLLSPFEDRQQQSAEKNNWRHKDHKNATDQKSTIDTM